MTGVPMTLNAVPYVVPKGPGVALVGLEHQRSDDVIGYALYLGDVLTQMPGDVAPRLAGHPERA